MGWETRRNGRRYYYAARRDGARVVKQYLGAGQLADAIAELNAQDARRHQLAAEAERAERAVQDGLHRQVTEACDLVDTLTRAVLLASGYHRHDRGEWRLRRASKNERHPPE